MLRVGILADAQALLADYEAVVPTAPGPVFYALDDLVGPDTAADIEICDQYGCDWTHQGHWRKCASGSYPADAPLGASTGVTAKPTCAARSPRVTRTVP